MILSFYLDPLTRDFDPKFFNIKDNKQKFNSAQHKTNAMTFFFTVITLTCEGNGATCGGGATAIWTAVMKGSLVILMFMLIYIYIYFKRFCNLLKVRVLYVTVSPWDQKRVKMEK